MATVTDAALTEAFNVWDPCGSKSINWSDFKDAVRCLGHPFTDAQFETVREVAGEKVELAQFKKLHAQLVSTHKVTDPEADLKAAFAAMDSDKTGKISKKMLKHFLTSVGEKLSAAEADALLQGCPDNVDYAAFKKAVLGL